MASEDPGAISPIDSNTVRWLATFIFPIVTSLLHATHLDEALHLEWVTESTVYQGLMGLLALVAVWKLVRNRIKTGADPANLNVRPIDVAILPNFLQKDV